MSVACSVSLTEAATSETVVTLSSSSDALKVPLSVNVASGKTSAAFDATASAVSTTQKVNLTATSDSVTESDTLILYPAAAPISSPVAQLDGLSCGTQSLTGAQTKTCSVSLSAAATNQMVVTLSSSSSALRAPASVTVANRWDLGDLQRTDISRERFAKGNADCDGRGQVTDGRDHALPSHGGCTHAEQDFLWDTITHRGADQGLFCGSE